MPKQDLFTKYQDIGPSILCIMSFPEVFTKSKQNKQISARKMIITFFDNFLKNPFEILDPTKNWVADELAKYPEDQSVNYYYSFLTAVQYLTLRASDPTSLSLMRDCMEEAKKYLNEEIEILSSGLPTASLFSPQKT